MGRAVGLWAEDLFAAHGADRPQDRPAIRLALARTVGQAGALEAAVEARALLLGFGCSAGLGGSHASPVGDLAFRTQTTDRGMVDGYSSPTTACGPRRTLLEPAARLRCPTAWVDPVGGCILGRPDVQVPGEASVRVVAQDVERDRPHLEPGAVHDGEAKARPSQDDRQRRCVHPGGTRLEPPDGGPRQPNLLSQLPLAQIRESASTHDVARTVEDLAGLVRLSRLCTLWGTRPHRFAHGTASLVEEMLAATGDTPPAATRDLLPKPEQVPIRQHQNQPCRDS